MQTDAGRTDDPERRLRAELEDTFPASDPPAVTRRQDSDGAGAGKRAQRELSANDARQGRIVLKSPLARAIFIAGLVGCALLAVWLSLHQ